MQSLEKRIKALTDLGNYLTEGNEEWQEVKWKAVNANAWFTEAHIDTATSGIVTQMLQSELLKNWTDSYSLPHTPQNVGIVMAGNIPMVGFHDLLCSYIAGHNTHIKLSSKDDVLMKHIVTLIHRFDEDAKHSLFIAEQLKNMDAYIATGSNNTARYFEQYFAKYPHIIRRNRTSVAILDGNETDEQLYGLGNDIFLYFGLGCRNITQLIVPENYDFEKLLNALKPFQEYIHHNKYKNNYDYQLAIYLLNKVPYMTDGVLLLIENEIPFSAVSVLHYSYYTNKEKVVSVLQNSQDIQAIVGNGYIPFGAAQIPSLNDYADGVDTMMFLCSL